MTLRAAVAAALAAVCMETSAAGLGDGVSAHVRAGYSLGGASPITMPAEIRSLDRFTLQPNISVGVEVSKPLAGKFGAALGVRLENKAMDLAATVKGYRLTMVQGGEEISGVYTGTVETQVFEWMVTVPLQAAWQPCRNVSVKAGPYLSVLLSQKFQGYAKGGYLRMGDPTGVKVLIGEDEDSRGSYDFSGEMRRMQYGVDVGADWRVHRRIGVFADINWGLTGVFHSGFDTIGQTLYPVFGTIGITYSLK